MSDKSLESPKVTSDDPWSEVAEAWDRAPEEIRQEWALSSKMLQLLDAQPGETVLDLAAGLGELGFAIAGRLGDTGSLITSDLSAAMLGYARRRAVEKGLTNVKFQVIDAQSMELQDSSIDGILCRFGIMLMPDQKAAALEMRRVLRDGGRAVVSTWAGPVQNPWMAAPGMALMTNGHTLAGPGPFDEGGVFSLSDPEKLSSLFKDSGFDDVDVEVVEEPWSFESFEQYWLVPTKISGPVAVALRGLSQDEVLKIREALMQILEPYREGEGYVLPRAALCLRAR